MKAIRICTSYVYHILNYLGVFNLCLEICGYPLNFSEILIHVDKAAGES